MHVSQWRVQAVIAAVFGLASAVTPALAQPVDPPVVTTAPAENPFPMTAPDAAPRGAITTDPAAMPPPADAAQAPDAPPAEPQAPAAAAQDDAQNAAAQAPDVPGPDAQGQDQGQDAQGADVQSADAQGVDAAAKAPQVATPLSGQAAQIASWVIATGDNGPLPFVIVDKLAAKIFVFDPGGSLMGGAPALVGLARGDDSADGVGDRELSAITPDERTTPAGRFVANFGLAAGHRTVLWVDYANAISLHPVVTSNPKEHRLARIRSKDADAHRISFGCINVPAAFYHKVVLKAFNGGAGVVYILPDTKPLEEVFPAYAALAQPGGVLHRAGEPTPQDGASGADPGAAPPTGAGPGPAAAADAPQASAPAADVVQVPQDAAPPPGAADPQGAAETQRTATR